MSLLGGRRLARNEQTPKGVISSLFAHTSKLALLFLFINLVFVAEGGFDGSQSRILTQHTCAGASGSDFPCNCNNALWEQDCVQTSNYPYKDYRKRRFVELSEVDSIDYTTGPPVHSGQTNICKWDGLTAAGVVAQFGEGHSESEPGKCDGNGFFALFSWSCCCPPGTMSWISTTTNTATSCLGGCGHRYYTSSDADKEFKCDNSKDVAHPGPNACSDCPVGRFNPYYSNPYRYVVLSFSFSFAFFFYSSFSSLFLLYTFRYWVSLHLCSSSMQERWALSIFFFLFSILLSLSSPAAI